MELCENFIQFFFGYLNDFSGICGGFIPDTIQIFGAYRDTAAARCIIAGIGESVENTAHAAGIYIFLTEDFDDSLSIGLKQLVLLQIHQIPLVYHIGIACKQGAQDVYLFPAGKRECHILLIGSGVADLEFHFYIVFCP